jgi:cytochrome c oxidase subunit 4
MRERPLPAARYLLIGAALLVLLALTTASAYLPLGPWNGALNLAIAAAKAALVALFFMQLKWSKPLVRVFAVTALFMLAILMGLSETDYGTRPMTPAAWHARER